MEPEVSETNESDDPGPGAAGVPPLTPNETLAQKVTEALAKKQVVTKKDADRCRQLLESGAASPEDWLQMVDNVLFSKPDAGDE